MKEIVISDGSKVKVDADDYDWLMNNKWSASGNGYAMRGKYMGNGKYKYFLMHREIIKAKKGEIVDHINGDKSDNRKCNLRIANRSQNATNSKHRVNQSGYRGVYLDKRRGLWTSEIRPNAGKRKFLGYFKSKEEAALAYNKAAIEYHGEFARLNKIKKGIQQ